MSRRARIIVAIALATATAGAHAFSGCWNQGVAAIAFGSVSIDRGTDAGGHVTLGCQAGSSPGYLRYCLYLPEGAPLGGIAPRRMTNYSGSQLLYDLYSDPPRTRVIGPPPAGGGFPAYTQVVPVSGNFSQVLSTVHIYGRVNGAQNVPAGAYEAQLSNAQLLWAFDASAPPPDCLQASAKGSISFYFNVTASVANDCRIGMATDLDFGFASGLGAMRSSTASITVRCPAGTPWVLGLGEGSHGVAGVRRMRSPAGQHIAYDLYKDPAHTKRWGQAGTDALSGVGQGIATPQVSTVYGRVPPQGAVPPGSYGDAILVTLTY